LIVFVFRLHDRQETYQPKIKLASVPIQAFQRHHKLDISFNICVCMLRILTQIASNMRVKNDFWLLEFSTLVMIFFGERQDCISE